MKSDLRKIAPARHDDEDSTTSTARRHNAAGAVLRKSGLPCPCGGGLYHDCCARFIDGAAIPQSALELMRSRYTAFALRQEAYLRASWWPETLPPQTLTDETDVKWIALNIIHYSSDAEHASVEFIARFKSNGRAHKLHEVSRFIRSADAEGQPRWFYVDGDFPGHTE